jgi:hypothetical protein
VPRLSPALFAILSCWTATGAQATAGHQGCVAERAHFAVGQVYTPELAEKARRAAGARAIRKIVPGAIYTRELRPDRLNIETGRRDIVVAVRCG